ncbi:hypothetical protein NitYY0826_C0905 [Nitratiruptor sp. YY08-26]|uniref:hypothetical protein n=1 Tax=unclassified Nitratiruptor TaxID=2624044 RepID=UPI0019159EF6|nr:MULTISPECIES: hypothetical protein [unclassified Nitratiruptor]BCD62037.1 hypothetical protein NitYY0813_C0903 [Nitratiruptor sp. YY08-13]BCD65973.1 hypothetical protein NitYY0826_C0905 [Nitratiruptor sp. YY08-26]
MNNFFIIAFFLDTLVIIFSFFSSKYFLLNSQLAFIASLLIVLGSYEGYKNVVQKKSSLHNRDIIDDIEDRFDLYSEDEEGGEKSAKEIFEEEKAKLKSKRAALSNFFKTSGAFFSPLRLAGYAFLTIVILVLIRKDLFDIAGFLIGLAVVPLSAALFTLLQGLKR